MRRADRDPPPQEEQRAGERPGRDRPVGVEDERVVARAGGVESDLLKAHEQRRDHEADRPDARHRRVRDAGLAAAGGAVALGDDGGSVHRARGGHQPRSFADHFDARVPDDRLSEVAGAPIRRRSSGTGARRSDPEGLRAGAVRSGLSRCRRPGRGLRRGSGRASPAAGPLARKFGRRPAARPPGGHDEARFAVQRVAVAVPVGLVAERKGQLRRRDRPLGGGDRRAVVFERAVARS